MCIRDRCQLCAENEGYAGRVNHPARGNHRMIPILSLIHIFRRQTGQRWKAQALNVGGGVSALVVLLHLAHLVGSEEGLQVVHLSLELTADIGL